MCINFDERYGQRPKADNTYGRYKDMILACRIRRKVRETWYQRHWNAVMQTDL